MPARAVRLAAVTGICGMIAAGCGPSNGGNGRRGGQAVPVRMTAVQRINVQRQVDLAGTLLSPDQAKVSAEAAGVVRQVLVEIGSRVKAGDPLVKLEPREFALALARAESALRQTRAQLGMHGPLDSNDTPPPDEEIASVKNAFATENDAKANFERAKVLNSRGLMSPVDLQTAETRMKVADAAYQAAIDTVRGQKALLQDRRASYDLAVKKLDDTIVRAPISGSVSERLVQVGDYIAAQTQVATIVQMNPLKLRTGVQERHAGVVQAGQPVEFRVEAFGDAVFHGKVAYVSPALDQTMRTFTIEALVDNGDYRLKPGFFAKGVILTRRDENVPAVPEVAISTLAGVSSVYVVRDGSITQQPVTLGVRQGNVWEVVDGLKGDETLAASRLNELANGVTVRAAGAEGEASPAARKGGGRRGDGSGGGRGDGSGGGRGRRNGGGPRGGGE